ncbi:hypothetical protein [Muribaculum intestinale]|uniref:hypothetical protein n=1 Tax=Muribaculum intestinale TaxID=1796646 RepID=UPI0025A9334F|nr:hypothetical protein [Muribaculum intestinale]
MATDCPVGTFSGQSGQCPHLSTQFSDRTPHLQTIPPGQMRRHNPVKKKCPCGAATPRRLSTRRGSELKLI